MSNNNHSQPVRHCMVVHNYYPFAETRVQRQAEALTQAGHQVDVICLRHGDEPEREHLAGVTVHRIPMRRKKSGPLIQLFDYLAFLIWSFLRLSVLHFQRRYHVVQVHNLPDFLVFAALIPRVTGSRIILDIHDLMPEFYCAKFNSTMNSLPVRLIRWQEWLSCRFAHHVITVTRAWRETLIERGVEPDKCTVVMNLADSKYFNETVPGNRHHLNDHFHLIYHGTITHRYGLDLILQALAQLKPKIPDLRLTIQGRGEYLESVLQLTNALALEEIVQINTDFLPLSDLIRIIKSAHVGLVPYRRDMFTDGILPTKLMEYTALGTPAIVARTPGISAYFDETTVEFFNPEDIDDLAYHIHHLYKNPARLQELARNTTRFNQQYNWTNQAAEYVGLIKELAAQDSKRYRKKKAIPKNKY